MSQALNDIDRRLANIVRIGTISELDEANARVKVDLGDHTTDWLPWSAAAAGGDRTWTTPDVGEQVTLFAPSGELADAVVGMSIFQDAHPANGNNKKDRRTTYKDGTVIEFDRDASVMNVIVNPAGQVNVTVGGSKFEMDTSRIKFTSNGSTFEMDAAGVRINGARIDLN